MVPVGMKTDNGRERAGKPLNHFRFCFLYRKTGAEMGYNGHGNGRESENLLECIII